MESQSLIYEAYRKIKKMIFQQKLIPGQRLVCKDLSKAFNMSQTPIINALNRLEQDGYVASEPHRGFYVRPYDLQEVWDAFGVREAVESYAVMEAVKRADTDDFGELNDRLMKHERYQDYSNKREKFFLDAQFHLQIAAMTHNRLIKYVLRVNFQHLYLRASLENYDAHRLESSAEEHHRLMDKMKKKDIVNCQEVIRNHIHMERDYLIRCLTESEKSEEYDYAL